MSYCWNYTIYSLFQVGLLSSSLDVSPFWPVTYSFFCWGLYTSSSGLHEKNLNDPICALSFMWPASGLWKILINSFSWKLSTSWLVGMTSPLCLSSKKKGSQVFDLNLENAKLISTHSVDLLPFLQLFFIDLELGDRASHPSILQNDCTLNLHQCDWGA